MELRDKNLNLRISQRLWDDLDAYCTKNKISKTEVVELGIELTVYGARLPEVKRGVVNEEVNQLANAIDVILAGLEALVGKYNRNILFLDEFSYRLSETKTAIERLKKDANV